MQAGRGGVFETLIKGPNMRELIDRKFLTDYRIFAPKSDINLKSVNVTPSGDFNRIKLAEAAHESHIVGDVVVQYQRFALGERGVTFATDVETANNLAWNFKLNGIPAAALSAKSTDDERAGALRAFKRGEILQLVNVDLFGEGFDLPSIRVVSFARPTASYGLYAQQFGRVLRPMPGKTVGKIIDHVGNVMRHQLPDRPIDWNLNTGRAPMEDLTGPPLRTCEECLQLWEGYRRECPFCGFTPEISERSGPEQVEGDLFELDAETLAAMRNEVARIDAPVSEAIAPLKYAGARSEAIGGLANGHRKRQEVQRYLRESMAIWGGHAKATGLTNSERHIKFYREFGVDVLSAQALGKPAAEDLKARVENSLNQF
jgi:superfamily II DNA or RNA helicase